MPNKPSNLPENSQPWARDVVEKGLSAALSRQEQTDAALANAEAAIASMTQQMQAQLDYIRALSILAGTSFPPVAAAPTAPVEEPDKPKPVYVTKEFPATWSATWYQSFKQLDEDEEFLIQRGSGYSFGMWGFDIGAARGKNITKAEMYMSNSSTYYNGAFTAILGTHGYSSEPGSRPYVGRNNGWDVGWSAGQGKYIALPAWHRTALSNGSIRGYTVGDGGTDRNNYARFNGVGRSGAPRLRLTYQV